MALQSITALATITLQSAAPSVTFSDIPDTYRDLIVVFQPINTTGTNSTFMRFNGDATTANYSSVIMYGTGSGSGTSTAPSSYAGVNAGDAFTTLATISIHNILDYAQTDKHKTILGRKDAAIDATAAHVARWASLSAINTISFHAGGGSLAIGSTFALFGRIA